MDHDSDSLVVSDQYDMDEGTRMQDQKKGTTAINALNALLEAEENIVPMAAAKSKFNSRVDLVNGHTLGSESDSSSYDEVVDDIPEHALEIRIRPNSELRDFPVVDYNSIISEVVEIFKEHGVTKYAVIRGDGVEEEVSIYYTRRSALELKLYLNELFHEAVAYFSICTQVPGQIPSNSFILSSR